MSATSVTRSSQRNVFPRQRDDSSLLVFHCLYILSFWPVLNLACFRAASSIQGCLLELRNQTGTKVVERLYIHEYIYVHEGVLCAQYIGPPSLTYRWRIRDWFTF